MAPLSNLQSNRFIYVVLNSSLEGKSGLILAGAGISRRAVVGVVGTDQTRVGVTLQWRKWADSAGFSAGPPPARFVYTATPRAGTPQPAPRGTRRTAPLSTLLAQTAGADKWYPRIAEAPADSTGSRLTQKTGPITLAAVPRYQLEHTAIIRASGVC